MSIFISHSSNDKELVGHLTKLLTEILPGTEIFSSSGAPQHRPEAGEDWFKWIVDSVNTCKVAIIILTPHSLTNQWVMWETGAIYGSTLIGDGENRILPISFGIDAKNIPNAISRSQASKGDVVEDIKEILGTVIDRCMSGVPERTKAFGLIVSKENDGSLKNYATEIDKYLHSPLFTLMKSAGDLTVELGKKFVGTHAKSDLLASAYSNYLDGVKNKVVEWKKNTLHVPSNEYPDYLISLQQQDVTVDALAVVDDVEMFWDNEPGDEICRGTSVDSRRIFSFKSYDHLKKYADTLLRHRKIYRVAVITIERANLLRRTLRDDFSIVKMNNGQSALLARYESKNAFNDIEFSSEQRLVNSYQELFDSIWNESEEVTENADDQAGFLNDMAGVFKDRRIEMSDYIEIDDYEKYEILHPYFEEMMDTMVEVFEKNKNREYNKVLEMGAGTGNFTLRIDNSLGNNGSLFAMEYDFECFSVLRRKIPNRGQDRTIVNESSSDYNPPGRFDFIFSSFADHHIAAPKCQGKYLHNIKQNLHSGSSFIVGDEFLPSYDEQGEPKQAQKDALNKYHGHIIDEAKRQQSNAPVAERPDWDQFIQLETAALNSGIEAVTDPNSPQGGDFKVPLNVYLERLKEAGLDYDEPIPIGPMDPDTREGCGGIFVIRAFLAPTAPV